MCAGFWDSCVFLEWWCWPRPVALMLPMLTHGAELLAPVGTLGSLSLLLLGLGVRAQKVGVPPSLAASRFWCLRASLSGCLCGKPQSEPLGRVYYVMCSGALYYRTPSLRYFVLLLSWGRICSNLLKLFLLFGIYALSLLPPLGRFRLFISAIALALFRTSASPPESPCALLESTRFLPLPLGALGRCLFPPSCPQ